VPVDVNLRTIAGPTMITEQVSLNDVCFPEFSPTRRLDKEITAFLSNHAGSYDIILGNDVLVPAGFDIMGSTRTIQWDDISVPWRPREYFSGDHLGSFIAEAVDDLFAPVAESFSTQYSVQEILESKYDQISTQEFAMQQTHPSQTQRSQLANKVRADFATLFSGKLGCYPHAHQVHLDLLPDATPFACRPYAIPHAHRTVFKNELDRLVETDVLSETGPSAYLSPTFIIPKKNDQVRLVSDFRKLNSMIMRKVYPLPCIHEILQKHSGYCYLFTKLDVSMQYYTFELDEDSKDLCVIVTPPFGNYRYNRLPMGVKQAPDIAQEVLMEAIFRNCPEVDDVYIDDIGIFSNSWEDHLLSLCKVLTILQDNNITVNPLKCEWAVQETDWLLGYWLTPTGLKPWKKKIQAILALQPPSLVKELRSFIGAVTFFYRDMFPRRSHLLVPLTVQVGRRNLQWTPECDDAFKAIKVLLAQDAFIRYPNHNIPFHVYINASDYHLGAAVIMQDNAPVAFFSRKLNAAQRKDSQYCGNTSSRVP
jgi:hypothetical protein